MNTLYGKYDVRDNGNTYSDVDGGESMTAAAAAKFKKKRDGKKFSRSAPCKYWPLGKCTNGNKCPYVHGKKFGAFNKRRKAAAATKENNGKTDAAVEDGNDATAAAAKGKGRGRGKHPNRE